MTTVPQVQITARDYLLSKGEPPISLNGAISLVAVLYRESRLSPLSQGYQSTEHGGVLNPHGAYGIASWNGPVNPAQVGDPLHDRQADLLAYATKYGLKVDALETQLAFVLNEIANKYLNCWAAIRSSASYQAIIPVLVDEYEIPANKPAEINAALAFAAPLAALPPPKPAAQAAPPATIPQAPAPKVPVPVTPQSALPAGLPPMSASSAGRRAAEQSYIAEMLNQLLAEQAQIAEEIAAFQQMAASLGKLNPAPTTQLSLSPVLPPPTAESVDAPPAKQEGSTTMPVILTNILTSWATSVLGSVAGGSSVIDVIQNPANWQHDLPGIATVLLGFVAKDGWVTGGTKQAPTPK